jgi:hypothetical protein
MNTYDMSIEQCDFQCSRAGWCETYFYGRPQHGGINRCYMQQGGCTLSSTGSYNQMYP